MYGHYNLSSKTIQPLLVPLDEKLEVPEVSLIPFIYHFLSYKNTTLLRRVVLMSLMVMFPYLTIHILPPYIAITQNETVSFWRKFET
jgi:hypothetical protein